MITALVSRECILEVRNDASRNRQVVHAAAYGQRMPLGPAWELDARQLALIANL